MTFATRWTPQATIPLATTLFIFILSSSIQAQEIRRPPDPPSPVGLTRGPVYLNSDSEGRLFNEQIPWSDGEEWHLIAPRYYLTNEDLTNLQNFAALDGFEIKIAPSGSAKRGVLIPTKSSGACPLPSSFTLVQSSGTETGNQLSYTSNKATGETTQWVVMVFYTSNYSGKNSHAGASLLFQDVVHGLGAIYGNNSGSTAGCTSQPYTTQLEAWAAWPGHQPINDGMHTSPSDPNGWPVNYWWQNKVWGTNDTFGSSCGANLSDGPTYALTIQANTSQDVAYDMKVWTGSAWSTISSWNAKNPTTPTWEWGLASAYFDPTAQGLFAWALPTGSSSTSDNYSINVTSFSCGWF